MNATLASSATVSVPGKTGVTGGAGAAPPARRLKSGTMASYGFGAAAYGVKDSGFGTFLLLFYNQVIGVPVTKPASSLSRKATAAAISSGRPARFTGCAPAAICAIA